eukprot:1155735-Pelagomonas_calceolata.AAC.1
MAPSPQVVNLTHTHWKDHLDQDGACNLASVQCKHEHLWQHTQQQHVADDLAQAEVKASRLPALCTRAHRADKAHEAEELAQRKADQEEKLSAAKQDEEKQEDTGPVQEHKQEGLLQKLGNLFVEKKHGEGGAPHEEHAEEAGKYKEAKEVEEKRETQEGR